MRQPPPQQISLQLPCSWGRHCAVGRTSWAQPAVAPRRSRLRCLLSPKLSHKGSPCRVTGQGRLNVQASCILVRALSAVAPAHTRHVARSNIPAQPLHAFLPRVHVQSHLLRQTACSREVATWAGAPQILAQQRHPRLRTLLQQCWRAMHY